MSEIDRNSVAYRYLKNVATNQKPGTIFYIYNFNYTESVYKILEELDYNKEEINKILVKVHGSLDGKGIKFGVEESSKLASWNQFLYKSHNDNANQIELNSMFESASQVEFFGHSLGETDHDYFTSFFR